MAEKKEKEQDEVEIDSRIADGLYTIRIEDVGLTLSQLQERLEKGKIEKFTEKQEQYISQLIVKGYVQETFPLKGVDGFEIGIRTLRGVGAQNAIILLKEIRDELKKKYSDEGDHGEIPDSYINNILQIVYVAKYLSLYGDQFNATQQPQDEFESLESIRQRYDFVKNLPGLMIDRLYGQIQAFNNIVYSAIAVDNIENF